MGWLVSGLGCGLGLGFGSSCSRALPAQFSLSLLSACFRESLARAMDATIYPDGVTVEATLKQVWQSTNLPAQFRVKMATQGLTELSIFAGISDTLTGFKESISTFFEEAELGATPPARILSLTRMGTAWEFARSLVKEKEANRTRLLEDPHRIPEISITEYTKISNRTPRAEQAVR